VSVVGRGRSVDSAFGVGYSSTVPESGGWAVGGLVGGAVAGGADGDAPAEGGAPPPHAVTSTRHAASTVGPSPCRRPNASATTVPP
jgi:hypothetical protein